MNNEVCDKSEKWFVAVHYRALSFRVVTTMFLMFFFVELPWECRRTRLVLTFEMTGMLLLRVVQLTTSFPAPRK